MWKHGEGKGEEENSKRKDRVLFKQILNKITFLTMEKIEWRQEPGSTFSSFEDWEL